MRTMITRMTRSRSAWALTFGVATLATIVLTVGNSQLLKAGGQPSNEFKNPKTFFISGQITGLYPGADKQLPLTIQNPHSFEIIVREIEVQITGTDKTSCPKTDVIGGTFVKNITIAKQGSAQTTVPISMIADSDNDCQGATFNIRYGGEAVKK